jgi:hypothetical protein
MLKVLKHVWRVIAKALGEKAHTRNELADQVAFVRFLILLAYMFTNLCIVLNTWRHWND